MDQYLLLYRHILEEYMKSIWAMNEEEEPIVDYTEHFDEIGKSFAIWLHCRCGQDGLCLVGQFKF